MGKRKNSRNVRDRVEAEKKNVQVRNQPQREAVSVENQGPTISNSSKKINKKQRRKINKAQQKETFKIVVLTKPQVSRLTKSVLDSLQVQTATKMMIIQNNRSHQQKHSLKITGASWKLNRAVELAKDAMIGGIKVVVPRAFVGAVIGKNNEGIKQIEAATGVHARVKTDVNDKRDRTCLLTGAPPVIEEARQTIKKIINKGEEIEEKETEASDPLFVDEIEISIALTSEQRAELLDKEDFVRKVDRMTGTKCSLVKSKLTRNPSAFNLLVVGYLEPVEKAKKMFDEKLGRGSTVFWKYRAVNEDLNAFWNPNFKSVCFQPIKLLPLTANCNSSVKWANFFRSYELHREARLIEKYAIAERRELAAGLQKKSAADSSDQAGLNDKWNEYSNYLHLRNISEAQRINAAEKDHINTDSSNETVPELNKTLASALLEKARTLKIQGQHDIAFEAVTAVCVLEGFTSFSSMIIAEEILYEFGEKYAQSSLVEKKNIMPSKWFIKNYLDSFRDDPLFLMDDVTLTSNKNIARVVKTLKDEKFDDIISICTTEIGKCGYTKWENKAMLLLLRGTFYLLIGDHQQSFEDLSAVINTKDISDNIKINALIKRATACMQLEKLKECFDDFEEAIKIDPQSVDIYFHRAQVNLLVNEIAEAQKDSRVAFLLHPHSGPTYVQTFFTYYYLGRLKNLPIVIDDSLRLLKLGLNIFDDHGDGYLMLGQLLFDKEEYQKADEAFLQASNVDPQNALIYVYRGILQLRWTGDFDEANKLFNKARKIDNTCGYAYKVLGSMEMKRGDLPRAIKYFDKALTFGQSVFEAKSIMRRKLIAKNKLQFIEKFGEWFIDSSTEQCFDAFMPTKCGTLW